MTNSLMIDGKIYIGIGDGDWLGAFHRVLKEGHHSGYTTKDRRGRYWLVCEKETVLEKNT